MNTRSFTFALGLAILAMILVNTYISDQEKSLLETYGQQVPIVKAKVDIAELELIDDSKVVQDTVPSKLLPPGAIQSIKEIENTVATVPILKNERITKPRITYPGVKTGLSRQISQGKRAMAININPQIAVSKLIKPGDRVDVISSFELIPGRRDSQKVQTVLQDVLVLSTGFNMTNSLPIMGVATPTIIKEMKLDTYANYNTVTVELDPNEVQKLTYILMFGGQTMLSLRNNNDRGQLNIGGTRIYEILNPDDRAEAKKFFQEKYETKR